MKVLAPDRKCWKDAQPIPDQSLGVDELEDISGHIEFRNTQIWQKLSPNQAAEEKQ